jgi:DNA-binding NarL/FixJ family response regulator
MRIVIVEDSAIIRAHLTTLLGTMTDVSIVGQAESEESALDVIEQTHPDLVILDLSLSPGSGFDVLKTLRATGNQCEVFVLTNQTLDHYRQMSIKLGANGFYDKNNGLENMLEKIKGNLPSA